VGLRITLTLTTEEAAGFALMLEERYGTHDDDGREYSLEELAERCIVNDIADAQQVYDDRKAVEQVGTPRLTPTVLVEDVP
jgi:hypothetical protein